MHTVVVGGGFGGVKAALELSKRQIGKVTLISDEPYFLHHATLYATATGRNDAESVIPLHTIFATHPNVEIIQDKITTFDPQRHLISSKKKDYHYDKLVLALGSVTTYFDVKGLRDHAYGIKTLNDLKKFREHIHDEVVSKRLDKELFVIGGGHTGIELASALNQYLNELKNTYQLKAAAPKVILVEVAPRILTKMSVTASKKVKHELQKQGIKVLTNHRVETLDENSITIDGKDYPTSTALWTSGVINNPFYAHHAKHFRLTPKGQVIVDAYLEALPDVYVIGDNNTVKYSGLASAAIKQAKHVAKNITRLATGRPQAAYHPTSSPASVPVGDRWGYVEWFGVYLDGKSGALLRRYIELHGYCQLMPSKMARTIWRAHYLAEVDDQL